MDKKMGKSSGNLDCTWLSGVLKNWNQVKRKYIRYPILVFSFIFLTATQKRGIELLGGGLGFGACIGFVVGCMVRGKELVQAHEQEGLGT